MCATLATRLRVGGETVSNDILDRKKLVDMELCQRYTLNVIELTRIEGSLGNLPGGERSSILPLGFCGIHNPERDPAFYGSRLRRWCGRCRRRHNR